eukprot:COSAG02_NODE_29269_length_572_cov_3.627907_2_plen_52_part_01
MLVFHASPLGGVAFHCLGGNSFLCQSTWTSPDAHVYISTTLTMTSVYVIFLW